jgi:hypothetical protein
MSMTRTKLLSSVGALTALLALAPSAEAQQCQTAADCGKGFTCLLVPVAVPVAKPACAPPLDCASDPPAPAADAGTQTIGYCEAARCTNDSDCGTTMVCHTSTSSACAGGTASACAKGVPCPEAPAPSPGSCTTTTVSTCAYRWQLPCKADAECGDGFTCIPIVTSACSGGGSAGTAGSTTGSPGAGAPTPAADGGAAMSASRSAPVPPGDSCVTTTSDFGACTPKATSCVADADCPAAWTCVDVPPSRTVSSPTAPDEGMTATAGTAGTNASAIAPGEPAPSGGANVPASGGTRTCQSPLGTFGGTATDTGGGTIETVGGAGGDGTKEGGSGSAAPMASSASPSAGAPSSGCALGGRAQGTSLAVSALALLGLVVARRRR